MRAEGEEEIYLTVSTASDGNSLVIGDWNSDLMESYSVEHLQRLTHIDKVVGIIQIEESASKLSSFQQLALPLHFPFLSCRLHADVNSSSKVRTDAANGLIGLWRSSLVMVQGVVKHSCRMDGSRPEDS